MMKEKKNRGVGLINSILLILILILVVFLTYEVIHEDIFDIFKTNNPNNPISSANLNQQLVGNINDNTVEVSEVVKPIIEQNQLQASEVLGESYHYYYNQLDENAKLIYKGLEDNIENMETGTYRIDFGTKFNDILNSEGGSEKLNIAFQSAWNAFTYDHVEVFYIDVTKLILTTQTTSIGSLATHKVYLSNAENTSYLSDEFANTENGTDVKIAKDKLENLRNQIITILDGYSDYEKIRYLHDWLIDNLDYDTTYNQPNIYNIYGALNNGTTVCEGYARSLKYILDGLGIQSVLISGNGTNSNGQTELHAWNYVKLDGKWYAIDLTWDDPIITNGGTITNDLRYKYFLRGSKVFFENHEEVGQLSDNSITFSFPTIEKEDYR